MLNVQAYFSVQNFKLNLDQTGQQVISKIISYVLLQIYSILIPKNIFKRISCEEGKTVEKKKGKRRVFVIEN